MDFEKIRNEQRFKILSLDQNDVLDIFLNRRNHMMVKKIDLPDECYVDSVHYNYLCRSFDFVIGSELFPSVPKGGVFPNCSEEIEVFHIQLYQDKDFKYIGGE